MTRDEMLTVGMKKAPSMKRRLMYRSRVDLAMAEDCSQEALLAICERWAVINDEIDGGLVAEEIIWKEMWRAASRYLYRNVVVVSKVKSLDAPIGQDDEELTLGAMLTSRRDPNENIEHKMQVQRAVKAMEALSGDELGILMAFADGVPLPEISEECGRPVIEVLQIKKRAADKIKDSAFSLVAEKLMLAAVSNPRSEVAKSVLCGQT